MCDFTFCFSFLFSQMLYLSGCDMNAVNIWLETSSGNSVYMVPVKNSDMKDWLKATTSNPSPLKQKCRYQIKHTNVFVSLFFPTAQLC